jgi:hypothetical protein
MWQETCGYTSLKRTIFHMPLKIKITPAYLKTVLPDDTGAVRPAPKPPVIARDPATGDIFVMSHDQAQLLGYDLVAGGTGTGLTPRPAVPVSQSGTSATQVGASYLRRDGGNAPSAVLGFAGNRSLENSPRSESSWHSAHSGAPERSTSEEALGEITPNEASEVRTNDRASGERTQDETSAELTHDEVLRILPHSEAPKDSGPSKAMPGVTRNQLLGEADAALPQAVHPLAASYRLAENITAGVERGIRGGSLPLRQRAANALLNHRGVRHIMSKGAQQHTSALAVTIACSGMLDVLEPADVGVTPASERYNITVRDSRNLQVSFQQRGREITQKLNINTRCHFVLGTDQRTTTQLTERFLWYTAGESLLPYAIDIDITQLTPQDVSSAWFAHLAVPLTETQIGLLLSRDGRRAIDTKFPSYHAQLSALTATTLVMKCYGELRDIARVFAFAPIQVAKDIRTYRLGAALGTEATRYLLGCIFAKLAENNFKPSQADLISAAIDLLVAHLSRDDHHQFLRRRDPVEEQTVVTKMLRLMEVAYAEEPTANVKRYAMMAALREGIIFGAMLRYTQDIGKHNASHVAILNCFADCFGKIMTAGIRNPPGGPLVAAVVESVRASSMLGVQSAIDQR